MYPTNAPANLSDNDIYQALYSAIVERRLTPGFKLGQDDLGEIFGVSKTRIRPILFQLASQKMVVIEPRRGAFVACPSIEEAKNANAVRQILEEGMVRALAPCITSEQVVALRDLVEQEEHARSGQRLTDAHRLTGLFHIQLATCLGNPVLACMLQQLVSRDSLAVALYQPYAADESIPEHRAIINALESHDADAAAARMKAHLQGIIARLEVRVNPAPASLAQALRPNLAKSQKIKVIL